MRLCLQVQCFPTMYMSHSRLFICRKLTVQFYHLRSLWTHCSLWCNGWLAVLSLVVGKILYRLCNSCCLYNCIEEHKLNFDCKHPECTVSPDRFRCEFCRWHFSKHLHQCINCGVQKELNWTAYQGSKKILQYSCLYMSVTAAAYSVSYW